MSEFSLASVLAAAPKEEREAFYASLSRNEAQRLVWDWRFWARPAQVEPEGEGWSNWLILAGRGFGKTRTGSEWIRNNMCGSTPLSRGRWSRVAMVAENAADARDVMAEGPSGILAVSPPSFRPKYEPSKRRLTWPNGAIATLYSAEDPEQLRGPEHEAAWCDELAKWRYCEETWDMLQFGLRLGDNPRTLITTTPRPIPLVRKILEDKGTYVTRGSTYDNAANLASKFLDTMKRKYEGTRLGRQELAAEILDDVPGALWTRSMLDASRLPSGFKLPDMKRIVVGVDPSGSSGEDDAIDSIGIVAAGLGVDDFGYVLADRSCTLGPAGWARRAVELYKELNADLIVGEKNYGGAMVEYTIRTIDRRVSYKDVSATRGKVVRAEPIASMYEQGRVRHVGSLALLEDQMVSMTHDGYLGDGSPDRVDAAIWAMTELFLGMDKSITSRELHI